MCGLHGTWTTACDHQATHFGQFLAQKHDLAVLWVVTPFGMASHNANDIFLIIKVEHFVQLTRDEMVVESTG